MIIDYTSQPKTKCAKRHGKKLTTFTGKNSRTSSLASWLRHKQVTSTLELDFQRWAMPW